MLNPRKFHESRSRIEGGGGGVGLGAQNVFSRQPPGSTHHLMVCSCSRLRRLGSNRYVSNVKFKTSERNVLFQVAWAAYVAD